MLHILTTNVSNGGLSVFNRNGLFIQQRQPKGKPTFQHIPGQLASLPRVVGASSAFPGFFPPVEITAADLGVREGHTRPSGSPMEACTTISAFEPFLG